MDEMIFDSSERYYNALGKLGYIPYSNAQKLLILAFYRDFVYHDYYGILSKEDYYIIERALDCLYGSTCLIPYPDYLKMGKLYLGEITEISQRLKAIENSEVLKLMQEISSSDASGSDIRIVESRNDFLTSFTVTPTSVDSSTSSILHFTATVTEAVIFQLFMITEDSQVRILDPTEDSALDFNYLLENPEIGTIKFVLTATDKDAHTITKEISIISKKVTLSITSFTVNQSKIYKNEESTLKFKGTTSKNGTLSILDPDGNVLYSVEDTNTIEYSHTVTPTQKGTLTYTMKAQYGDAVKTKEINISVQAHSYNLIYYGNSSERLTTGTSIQELNNANVSTVTDTYNQAFYYIVIHSTKSLKSVINRDVEYVTENFVLKDEAFILNEDGADQKYKLYECNINEGASSEDMYIFELTINIE